MIAGHLQEKKGLYYIVLNCKDEFGKRKPKWIPTGLSVKGNKKKAEALLLEARQNFVETPKVSGEPPENVETSDDVEEEQLLFADFLLQWLEMMKHQVEFTTYVAYYNVIHNRVAPYFREKNIFLNDLQPKHIQDFYNHVLTERGVTPNTVIHYHANIRKALQYAYKTEMISANPADKVERPKKNAFVGSFYDSTEMNKLFAAVKGDPVELAVILGAFYGLRRSEVVGLKWNAINFQNRTLTIQHTVVPVFFQGEQMVVEKDRAKNKASHRTLPLVPAFEDLLLRIREQQKQDQTLYKSSYCKEFQDYVYLDKLGQRIKAGYITQHFTMLLAKQNLRRIRFHDLRHSCASLLLANGVSMKEIQEWLGHSNFSTTANTYAHLEYSAKVTSAHAMSQCLKF
ncbi:tyrosine-type recombinase/integrase [Paenibacillus durus]|uniref:Integrase n=1 Tax=Paenibacillus durus TaxID=44251 RepID=A0A089HSZ3_PAEDU|nr:site-specific integrase [Paenibacillus durus]AIQ13855.1 integrase [Paenibacillus durus]